MQINTKRLQMLPCTEDVITTTNYTIGPHILMHVASLRQDPTLLGWGPWLVINENTNEIIGDIGFKGKPNSQNTVEIGYGMIPTAQNNGYATEAVKSIINWAFSFPDVKTIIAECSEDNHASIRVLEKVGMSKAGKDGDLLKWIVAK